MRPYVEGWREVRVDERGRLGRKLTGNSVHENGEAIYQWLVKGTSELQDWKSFENALNVQYGHEAKIPEMIVDSFITAEELHHAYI